jgi:phytoene dehydrogenase-like protein
MSAGASYDAIVIGAGHNGLVTAALLARAGKRVLVLEQRPVLGGAAATEPVFPGFQVSTGAHDAHLLRPEVVSGLDLRRHGLEFVEAPALVFAPRPDGPPLTLWRDAGRTGQEIAAFSTADAERYPAFMDFARRLIGVLDEIMVLTPPDPMGGPSAGLLPWLRVALGARRLGRQRLMDLVRILPMTAAEWLAEWFEGEAVAGVLGAAAVAGGPYGPQAAGTAFMLLYQRLGPAGGHQFVCGGVGRLSEALASVARQHGAEVRTGAPVRRIEIADDGLEGAVAGVTLATGETLRSRVIVSSADPRRTLFDLAGAAHLEPRVMRQVRSLRYRGTVAKVNLALGGLPEFTGAGADRLGGHILLSPSLAYLERGADEAKYGRLSERPFLDVVIPTLLDSSLAPPGRHLMSVTVQWAPYHLRGASWDDQREALGERVLDALEPHAPGLRDLVIERQVLTPLDWEREYGLTEGNPYHGEMGLDQLLFMRPVPGYSQYRAPIAGLFLCGAGTHPGGGLTGAPGYNAAREALKALR